MKYTLEDGSVLEFETNEAATLIELGILPKPKTLAEQARARLDAAMEAAETIEEFDDNESVVVPPAVVETKPHPATMPKHVEPAPVAYVNQAQDLVLGVLRHHPEGLKTKQVAEKLRWDHPKATATVTAMERGVNGMPKLIEKIPGTYRYRLTPFAKRAAVKIVGQPSRYREPVS